MKRKYIKPEIELLVVNNESLLNTATVASLNIDGSTIIYGDDGVGAKGNDSWDDDEF